MFRSECKNDLHKPWYEVWCNEDSSGSYSDKFLIDGTTGETLYMEKHVDNVILMTPEEELKTTTNKFPNYKINISTNRVRQTNKIRKG